MDPDDDDLQELVGAFVTASRALVAIAVRSLEAAPVAVTAAQHRVLVTLAAEGPRGVGEIARELGVNPSNATRICDRLQRLHLVDRTPSQEDGRAVQVAITPAGNAVVDAVVARRWREVSEVLTALSLDEVRGTIAALEAFNDAAHERAVVARAPETGTGL